MVTCSVKTSPKPSTTSTIFFFYVTVCKSSSASSISLHVSLTLIFSNSGMIIQVMFMFFVLSYLCFNLLGSIIWHSYLWLLSLKCFFWTVCSLRHNTSKSKRDYFPKHFNFPSLPKTHFNLCPLYLRLVISIDQTVFIKLTITDIHSVCY